MLGSAATIAIAGVTVVEAFAWLLPQNFADRDGLYVRLAAVSFFTRVFQFHLAAALLVPTLVAFAIGWRRVAIFSLGLVACLMFPLARDLAPKRPPAAASPTVRVMAINLYFMNRDGGAILRAIEAADPDVISLAEVTPWSWDNVITPHLLGRYRYIEQPRFDGGAVVLSRLPCKVGAPATRVGETRGRAPVVFEIGGREVAFYAVHLVSPGHWWLIGHNRDQVASFAEIARAETRPMIIAGDCNFTQLTPNAFALRRVSLRTTHDLVGWGLGDTWGPRWWPRLNRLPGVRIDHIFMSQQLTALSHHVGPDTGSDHRPIVADIALAATP